MVKLNNSFLPGWHIKVSKEYLLKLKKIRRKDQSVTVDFPFSIVLINFPILKFDIMRRSYGGQPFFYDIFSRFDNSFSSVTSYEIIPSSIKDFLLQSLSSSNSSRIYWVFFLLMDAAYSFCYKILLSSWSLNFVYFKS